MHRRGDVPSGEEALDGPRPPAGPHRPLPGTPRQAAGAARRTTTIDTIRPDGPRGAATVVELRGRDRRLDPEGAVAAEHAVGLRFRLDPATGEITAVEGPSDDVAGLDGLVGASVRAGFGRAVAGVLGDELAARTLRASMLEDLSGAVLVSGYAPLRAGAIRVSAGGGASMADHQGDICVGWAAGGEMHSVLAEHDHVAVPLGPAAPDLAAAGVWHPDPPLAEGTVRRRRRLDVAAAGDGSADRLTESHLRDTYRSTDGDEVEEMVLHEYVVRSIVGGDGRLVAVDVDPRTLPWRECTGGASSAQALVGVPLDEVARRARTALVGPTTCTHLTSTLRALADVAALVEHAPAPGAGPEGRGGQTTP